MSVSDIIFKRNMKKVNIIIGRFQPFTKGHLKCVFEAWKKLNIPTIIVMIDTPNSKVDEKHPFPSSMLLPLYKEIFKDYKEIERVILSKSANIISIGEELYEMGYEVQSWTCGTDRYHSYKRMAEKYKNEAHLSDDFKLIEIKRSDEDISATAVRAALLKNDYDAYSKLMPLLSIRAHLKTNLYNTLREQLLKVYGKI